MKGHFVIAIQILDNIVTTIELANEDLRINDFNAAKCA
jgi:hypothetical protein